MKGKNFTTKKQQSLAGGQEDLHRVDSMVIFMVMVLVYDEKIVLFPMGSWEGVSL